MTSPQPAFAPGAPGAAVNGSTGPGNSSTSTGGSAPSSAPASSGNGLVSTEEELVRLAPQPHERVIYWGSGSPQGAFPSLDGVAESSASPSRVLRDDMMLHCRKQRGAS